VARLLDARQRHRQVGWPNSGEIDIMENVGFEPSTVHGTLHGPGYSGSGGIGAGYSLPGGQAFADAFHTFAIDWSPDAVTWSVDGNVYQRRTPADLGGKQWVFNKPFFLILNLAVGGYWPGDPNSSTVFPQQLVVDEVKVTTSDGSGGGAPIRGLAGKCVDVAGRVPPTARPFSSTTATAPPPSSGPWPPTARSGRWASAWTSRATARRTVRPCSSGTAGAGPINAGWSARPNDIVNPQANKCLDVTGNSSANGTRLQIWTCSGGANQKWTVG
jgi:hypothetical protein